jgi:ribulose-phosphate 3-epimerase
MQQKRTDRYLIAPSILSADFGSLSAEVRAVESAGADLIHIDVMDGIFVPNITIGPDVVLAVDRSTNLPLDVHLMIERPERYIERFIQAGADIVTVHIEASPHCHRCVQMIKRGRAKASVAINPATPAEALLPLLEDGQVDMLLVMSVNPGFGGQKFIGSILAKMKWLRNQIESRGIGVDIEVDGGIGPENIATAARSGANIFVAGNAIFRYKDKNYREIISILRSKLQEVDDGDTGGGQ